MRLEQELSELANNILHQKMTNILYGNISEDNFLSLFNPNGMRIVWVTKDAHRPIIPSMRILNLSNTGKIPFSILIQFQYV